MPAASLNELLDFETQLETACVAVLAADSITAFTQRNANDKVAPRVDVQASITGDSRELKKVGSDYLPNSFTGQIQFTISTRRGAAEADHVVIRGKIRKLMFQYASQFTLSRLPYLGLFKLASGPTSPGFMASENHDQSTLTFDIAFKIRDTAWP